MLPDGVGQHVTRAARSASTPCTAASTGGSLGASDEAQGLRGVFVPEDGALASLEAARELGIAGVYELPIGYWRAAHEIYREERERKPEWAATLTGTLDSQEKLARKDEELRLAGRVVVASSFTRRTLELAPSIGGPVELVPVRRSPCQSNEPAGAGQATARSGSSSSAS